MRSSPEPWPCGLTQTPTFHPSSTSGIGWLRDWPRVTPGPAEIGQGRRSRTLHRTNALSRWPPLGERPPVRGHPPFHVPTLPGVLLEAPPRDVERLFQHELEILLRPVPRHSNLVPPDLDVDADAEVVAPLVMPMRNVSNHVARDDPGTERIELAGAFADFGFDERIWLLTRERDDERLPHA